MLIKPQKLKVGDTIGIISPSGYLNDEGQQNLKKGIKFLGDLGFKVKIGKNALKRYFYSAGTAKERADDLHAMFLDSDIKAVFQSQGGETENEILEYVDWEVLRSHPKIFGGMSDGTVLALAIYAKTSLVTLHGPDVVWGYGRGASKYEKENLLEVLTTGNLGEIKPDSGHMVAENSKNSSQKRKCWRSGVAEGILIGGNISVIKELHDTEYFPDPTGAILFLEGVGLSPEKLASDFTCLKQWGMFNKISGVILGYFNDNVVKDPEENRPVGEVFLEATQRYNFPILEIGEIGHNTSNAPLPIGVKAKMDTDKLQLSIIEKVLS